MVWRTAIQEGRLPVVRGVILSDDDRLRGAAIERLMWLEFLADDGLIAFDGDRVAMTPAGKPFVPRGGGV